MERGAEVEAEDAAAVGEEATAISGKTVMMSQSRKRKIRARSSVIAVVKWDIMPQNVPRKREMKRLI